MIEVKKKGGRVRDNPIILCYGNVTVGIETNRRSTYLKKIWDQLEWSCCVKIVGFEVDGLCLKWRYSADVIDLGG